MNSEDPSHDKEPLVVPFRTAEGSRHMRKPAAESPPESAARDRELLAVLASPLHEDKASKSMSDEQWRQRSVDNILALLKANAELRALAVKLADILAARTGWDRSMLDKATRAASAQTTRAGRN